MREQKTKFKSLRNLKDEKGAKSSILLLKRSLNETIYTKHYFLNRNKSNLKSTRKLMTKLMIHKK